MDLKLSENSPLDKSDLERVVTFVTANKLSDDQAVAILKEHEATAAALITRRQPAPPPDKYELKLSENSALDKSDLDKIAAYAKANKFSQEQAAALVKEQEAAAGGVVTRQQASLTQLRTQWENEVKADKDIGGDKLADTLKNTKRVMDRFAPEGSALRKILDDTGYGNHPEWVRFVNAIGKTMSEDRGGSHGSGGGGGDTSWQKKMYPNLS